MKDSKHQIPHPLIKNPQIPGDPFNFKGGPVGILLVHGLTATTAEMRPLGKYLHKKGFTVSAPLLPGHNTYPEDINNFTWKDWVEEVEIAYKQLRENHRIIFVGGESTGGLLALYIATYHPEIAGILTFAPALKVTLSPLALIALYAMAPFKPFILEKKEDDGLAWRGYMAKPLKGVIQLLRLQKATLPRLGKINHPLLIVQGRLDQTVHSEVPEIISHAVNADPFEIHWMENSTHCVVLDKESDRVNQITYDFINNILD